MKTILYWGPFIDNKIATVKAIYNSAIGANRYLTKYHAKIINTIGEWDFKIDNNNKKYFLNTNLNLLNYLPKYGFFKSRFSYLIIFFISFFKIKKIIEKQKPDFFIAHLIVSVPLLLFKFYKFDTKLILRISGKPKFNLFRKSLWKFCSNSVDKVFCPTTETREILIKNNIYSKEKIFVLNDPVINLKNFRKWKNENNFDKKFEKNNIILAGRLTNQKNFNLIIDAYTKNESLKKFKIFIFGAGENEQKLRKKILINNLDSRIFIMGHKKNIFKYMIKSKVFILTSLWEDPGFVLIEAAMSNLAIIASNCPSGPEEIISKEEFGGYLFNNNEVNDLNKKIIQFINDDEKEVFKKKCFIKKNIKKFTTFNHVKLLEKLIDSKIYL